MDEIGDGVGRGRLQGYARAVFRFFDGSYRENFCAAALVAALDGDPTLRSRFEARLRALEILRGDAQVLGWGREARLVGVGRSDPRSDLWLRVGTGEGAGRIVIEVKTRYWDPDGVVRQLARYRDARLRRGGESVVEVALLAPADLCAHVAARLDGAKVLAWSDLLAALDGHASTDIGRETLRHFARLFGGVVGMSTSTPLSIRQTTSAFSCLFGFLHQTIARLGGRPRRGVNLPPGNADPLRQGGWTYYGLSVPFEMAGRKDWYLGLYEYIDCPAGMEDYASTPHVELYRGDDFICDVVFDPADMSAAALEEASHRLVERAASKLLAKPPGAGP